MNRFGPLKVPQPLALNLEIRLVPTKELNGHFLLLPHPSVHFKRVLKLEISRV
jgi:hypothetical protein